MRIITISRQFGSGGRELGKRLADILGWDYYDKEIIQQLADEKGLNPDYISNVLHNHQWTSFPLTYRNSFSEMSYSGAMKTELLVRQREILENIAAAGHDCIIVGRDADVILQKYNPFKIFVCADLQSRIDRCMRRESQKNGEKLSEKEIAKNIRRIDKNRSQTREMLTGKDEDDCTFFNFTVNASQWNIKALAPAVADFALKWFEQYDNEG